MTAAKADVLVYPVNCAGVMGAGAAKQFRRRFPRMYEDYRRACLEGRVYIKVSGNKIRYRPHVWLHPSRRFIILNLPTKIHWKQPSRYEYVAAGLQWIRANFSKLSALTSRPIRTIATLAIGCGLGGAEVEQGFPDDRQDALRPLRRPRLFSLNIIILFLSNFCSA